MQHAALPPLVLPCLFAILLAAPSSALLGEEPHPRDTLFRESIEVMFPRLVETRRDIHAHPELSNEEERTAALVAERLLELGLEVRTGVAKHGVVALLHGGGEGGRCVAVRADMDALPITQLRSLPYRSRNPGVMHACGHDVHTTVALGLAEVLAKHRDQVRGTVRTYDAKFRDGVVEMMEQVLQGVAQAHGAQIELDYRKGYPSVINDEGLARSTLPALRRVVGEGNLLEMVPGMGGEDFAYFAQVSPGFYFRLGVANEAKGITGEIHTPLFDVDEECLKTGVAALAAAVCDFLDAGE